MASKGINKAIIVGNLGNDPEMRYMPNGNAVVNISVATSESWVDKNTGQPQERTEWHRIVAYGKLAEIMGQYLRKGSQVYIEGSIRTRKWQAQDGSDRYSTEPMNQAAAQPQAMQQNGGYNQAQPSASQSAPTQNSSQQFNQEFKSPQINTDNDFTDEDIPF